MFSRGMPLIVAFVSSISRVSQETFKPLPSRTSTLRGVELWKINELVLRVATTFPPRQVAAVVRGELARDVVGAVGAHVQGVPRSEAEARALNHQPMAAQYQRSECAKAR